LRIWSRPCSLPILITIFSVEIMAEDGYVSLDDSLEEAARSKIEVPPDLEALPVSQSREEELMAQLSRAQMESERRLDQLVRCRADLDNLMKRSAKEKDDYARYAAERLIARLLPVLDSLEAAAKHDEGAGHLYRQLLDVLGSEGLKPIVALGRKYDPYQHEALYQVRTDEGEEDTVVEEIQKGYLLHSRVIRFSKVAVGKRE
jgi:molecular chaperone GrpE